MATLGRPKKVIDWELVKKMCEIHCTGKEIAYIIGVHYDTLADRCEEENTLLLSDYIQKHSASGKMSLRRWQFEAAKKGNVTMQIWLGKQYLNQREPKDLHASIEDAKIKDDKLVIDMSAFKEAG